MKYVSPTKPMKHQVAYKEKVKKRPRSPTPLDVMAIRGEMGTGKSKMALDEWQDGLSSGKYTDIMVIAPSGSYRNWYQGKNEIQKSELEAHLDPRLMKDLIIMPWETGGGKEKRRRLQWGLTQTKKPRAMFINFEALSTVEECVNLAEAFLKSGKVYLVIDESTKIKAGKSERTKIIIKRLKPLATARRIMTGYITPKSPLDLYWQYNFLDWRILGYESPIAFRSRYAIVEKQCVMPNKLIKDRLLRSMGIINKQTSKSDEFLRKKLTIVRKHLDAPTSKIPLMPRDMLIRKLIEEAEIMGRADMLDVVPKLGGYLQMFEKVKEYQNLEELYDKTEPYSFKVLKKDCLDLKPKIYQIREVELTKEQRAKYDEIKQNAFTELNEEDFVTTDSVIKRMLRLHQIVCGHVKDDDGDIHDLPSNRIKAILELIEEHEGKVIIWATYQHEIRKIAAALKEVYGPRSTAMFYGGNKKSRGAEEIAFLSKPECRFMISTQSAGGIGNTWNVANLTIYAANNYDLELRVQSEDRNHRKGQHDSVTYVDLLTPGTVEEPIIRALRTKMDLAAVVNGENFVEWLI